MLKESIPAKKANSSRKFLIKSFAREAKVPNLDRELELLALEDLGVVDIEEVAVENGLYDAGNDGNPANLVLCFHGVPVDPVGDVESSVASEGE